MFAFSLGIYRSLYTWPGVVLLAIFGLGKIVSGLFRPDAVRGYLPGAPNKTNKKPTLHSQIHDAAGPISFFVILAACLTLAPKLYGPWRLFTVVTAVAGLTLTIGTALSWKKDARYTGLVQRILIIVYLS